MIGHRRMLSATVSIETSKDGVLVVMYFDVNTYFYVCIENNVFVLVQQCDGSISVSYLSQPF